MAPAPSTPRRFDDSCIGRPALADQQAIPARQPGDRHGETLVLGNGLLQVVPRLDEGILLEHADPVERMQRVIVGGEALRPLAHRTVQLGCLHTRRDAGDHAATIRSCIANSSSGAALAVSPTD